jgi:hypothetical protein
MKCGEEYGDPALSDASTNRTSPTARTTKANIPHKAQNRAAMPEVDLSRCGIVNVKSVKPCN